MQWAQHPLFKSGVENAVGFSALDSGQVSEAASSSEVCCSFLGTTSMWLNLEGYLDLLWEH